MLRKCKDCKHWERHPIRFATLNRTGKKVGRCTHPKHVEGSEKAGIDGVSCFVDLDRNLVMQSGEIYGCTHHDSVESAKDDEALNLSGSLSEKALQRQSIWKDISHQYIRGLFNNEEVLKSKWLAHAIMGKYNFKTFLEIGCGPGRNIRYMKTNYPDVRYSGCDICSASIHIAKREIPSADFEICSLYKLPYFDGQFDMTLVCSVFMFVPPEDLSVAVKEAKRVTKRHIVEVEWFTKGSYDGAFDKELTWNRDYTQLYEPEFRCIDVHPMARAYIDKDVPLFCWVFERQEVPA